MREQAFIDIKPGFTDSGASPRQTKPIYSAYVPPAPKKKKKIERTRFRETTRSFRQKSAQAAAPAVETVATPAAATTTKGKKNESAVPASQKPGKKEKIRLGRAPTKTLPSAPETKTEDAGATDQAATSAPEPVNPLETNAKPEKKTRFSARAKLPKQAKARGPKVDTMAPAPADSAEVADRQTQAGPLGLAGDTSKKKKKKATTTGDKTRLTDKKKTETKPEGDVPLGPAPQIPAQAPSSQPAAPAPQK